MKKRWIAIFGLCLMTFTGTPCARPAQKESAELVQNPPVREPAVLRKQKGRWDWCGTGSSGRKNIHLAKEKKLPGINVLSPSWFVIRDTEGNIEVKNASPDYAPQAHASGYKVWALITNGFDPERTHGLLDNPAGRRNAVEGILALAKQYQLDGINLDFENIQAADSERLTDFVGEIAGPLQQEGIRFPSM